MSQPAVETGLVGAVLSRRWRIVSPIGAGGMGLVFVGEGVQDGRRVAIKVLRPELVSEALIRSRFVEEAASTMRLHHVNILRVFEAAEAEDGSPYIVMELLDGVPLSAYTSAGERVPVGQAATILRGVLRGLAAAHAGGIVHRDLKPENVFLARDAASGQFVVKLLDFGIAKVMDVAGGMGNKTKTGMLLGTPAYMSPEQVKSSRDTDPRTDLWSAGVLFYELLTGKQAFRAPTEFARLSQILGGQPDPLASVDPALATWQPFMDRALQKDRMLRFQTANEMEQALGAGGPVVSQIMSAVPHTPLAGQGPVAITMAPHVQSAAAYTPTAQSMPAMVAPSALENTTPSPGGTLGSQRGQGGARPSAAPPEVRLIPPPSGDLESRSFRGREQRRVSAIVVVLLVLMALGAGFAIGFAVGRM